MRACANPADWPIFSGLQGPAAHQLDPTQGAIVQTTVAVATSHSDAATGSAQRKAPGLSVALPRVGSIKSRGSQSSEDSSCSAASKPFRTTPHPRGRWGASPWTSMDMPAAPSPQAHCPPSPPRMASPEKRSPCGMQPPLTGGSCSISLYSTIVADDQTPG